MANIPFSIRVCCLFRSPASVFLTNAIRSSRNREIGQGEALAGRVVSQAAEQGTGRGTAVALTILTRYYSSCNAGLSWTHLANRQAFYRHRIIPRQLVDTNIRDTATDIFGHRVAAPVGFAPIGINRIYHPTGELSVARVAQELNLVYSLSSAGSYSIEDVGKANGSGPRFFQLYQSHDDEVCISMLQRAFDSGFDVCMVTTDTWSLGWRHNDVFNGNYAFYHEHGAGDLGLQDPVFLKRLAEVGIDPKKDPKAAGAKWIDENIWHGRAHTWEKMKWTMEQWKRISGGRPFCLKGIQSVEDAKKAVEMYVGIDFLTLVHLLTWK
jgi:isopentenyl diphosphate isomerase/L-lactate dehydrogenase-like FMN-dependent dehydrogenase